MQPMTLDEIDLAAQQAIEAPKGPRPGASLTFGKGKGQPKAQRTDE
ncbi:hypothetical protein [Sinorhizobium chiapasense]|uniref:Transposase n=1 Tax=Sinorhizobium chiapasense TaxID=501572 RepID=A0ABZ2BAV3_9HYPH